MNETIQIIVETPMGSGQKFDRDLNTGLFELTKLMPKGMSFPFDFGYIPGTLGSDGDPLDVVVISETPTFSGCQLNCRIIGCLEAEQTEKDGKRMRNDRYIGVPDVSNVYSKVQKLADLPTDLLSELESFFINYNIIAGKQFKILKRTTAAQALSMIEKSLEKEDTPTVRLEILLPVANNNGKPFPKEMFSALEQELIKNFSGLTVYSSAPITGFWKPDQKVLQQQLMVYELFLREFDPTYWEKMKRKLEKKFNQTEVMIICGPTTKIK